MRANTTAWIQAIALVGVTACQSSPEQPSQPRTDLKTPSAAEPSVADGHASGAGEPALRHVKPPWRDMGFVPSEGLRTERLVLEPLAPRHVELDHAALMGSREHLLRTLHWGDWPREGFTVEENLDDLEMHWGEFEDRTGFAFTVLNPARDRCLGCRYCVQACPYGCRYIDPRAHVVDKCSLCYHRITRGLTTACCETCPTDARVLGDLKDPKDPIHEFLRTHTIQVLKPQMATGSKVYYAALDGSVR